MVRFFDLNIVPSFLRLLSSQLIWVYAVAQCIIKGIDFQYFVHLSAANLWKSNWLKSGLRSSFRWLLLRWEIEQNVCLKIKSIEVMIEGRLRFITLIWLWVFAYSFHRIRSMYLYRLTNLVNFVLKSPQFGVSVRDFGLSYLKFQSSHFIDV